MNFKEYMMSVNSELDKKLYTYKIRWLIPSEVGSGKGYTSFLKGMSQNEVQNKFMTSDRIWAHDENSKRLVHFGGEKPTITSITPVNFEEE